MLILLFVALMASITAAHAEPPAPPAGESGVASDQPPVMTAGQRRARNLWASLSETDKAFIRDFTEKNNLTVLSPKMLYLRATGKNNEALKMMAKYYDLNDPVRAEIILKLLAYANDQR
jgi:hypothetical protein